MFIFMLKFVHLIIIINELPEPSYRDLVFKSEGINIALQAMDRFENNAPMQRADCCLLYNICIGNGKSLPVSVLLFLFL